MSNLKLPEVLSDGGVVMPEGPYTILKIGNRDEPELFNQDTQFAANGSLWTNVIKPGEPVGLSNFRTSLAKSIYVHNTDSGYDKLVLPKDFPQATDLRFPEKLKEGDVLIATMNSVYWLQPARDDIPTNYGYGMSDSDALHSNGTSFLSN